MVERQRGVLFLVVGPSGVGKDSLLSVAKEKLNGDARYVFARREITRPVESGGEDHTPVSPEQFEERVASGRYALWWRAHGMGYGIPRTMEQALQAGRHVVANVSRTILDQARQTMRPERVVAVSAQPAIIEDRLRSRGRESEEDIRRRLARIAEFDVCGPDVIEIDNSGSLEQAARRFTATLLSVLPPAMIASPSH